MTLIPAQMIRVFTIGFTKTTAEHFFTRLQKAGVRKLVDIRLKNVSHLAGFAQKDDLRYFLKAICGIDYEHRLDLAPTEDILNAYRKGGRDWDEYERKFLTLMGTRRVEETLPRDALDNACLLCSEDEPLHCHRRLVAEYLRGKWGDVEVVHL